jgi:hypothetical protein
MARIGGRAVRGYPRARSSGRAVHTLMLLDMVGDRRGCHEATFQTSPAQWLDAELMTAGAAPRDGAVPSVKYAARAASLVTPNGVVTAP